MSEITVSTPDRNREAWLTKAVAALEPLFTEAGWELPTVHVSCGWPDKGGTKSGARVIGQCWWQKEQEAAHLFISPVLDDAVTVLDTLVHELAHAVDHCENGHKGRFWAIAKAVGQEGKPTSSTASAESREALTAIAEALGAYPHDAIVSEPPIKKQTTRMIKVVCPECDYTLRTTQKWIEVGLPTCPCGTVMEADAPKDEDADA